MDQKEMKQLIADTGRELLKLGLVARTWGNISARVDEKRFAISPSGLGYENMQGDDVPVFNMADGTREGSREPSSEKKVHAAAYRLHPDVDFVIHTHQDYATAVGLAGCGGLVPNDEERELLGDIKVASYGLPGTDKLAANVEEALRSSKVVLMAHHGVLVAGRDRDDAIRKAKALEDVCKRAVLAKTGMEDPGDLRGMKPFRAQLDDMAQMLGRRYSAHIMEKALAGMSPDDREALKILVRKAAIAKRYSEACGVKGELSLFDCLFMRAVYVMKYSKKKDG